MNEVRQIVHTKTQEQFDRVIEILKRTGRGGVISSSFNENWSVHKEDTHLYIRDSFVTYGESYRGGGISPISYNQFLLDEGIIRYVYVSDESVEDALEKKEKRILVHDLGEQFENRYITVNQYSEERYIKGKNNIYCTKWKYIAEIPKEEPKIEMSIGEIADKLGIDKNRLLIKE